jgi:hypothetical protein
MFLRTILIAAAIAVAAVGLAAPSHADTDDPESDATFARLLDNEGILFNFRLEKYQGQRYCRSVIDGDTPVDATQDLMRNGSYSWDVANGITSAAMVAYCECTVSEREGVHANPTLCRPFELNYRSGGD